MIEESLQDIPSDKIGEYSTMYAINFGVYDNWSYKKINIGSAFLIEGTVKWKGKHYRVIKRQDGEIAIFVGKRGRKPFPEKLSSQEFLTLLRSTKIKIIQSVRASNSYGNFRFITVEYYGVFVIFYGNGFHELRNCNIPYWTWFRGSINKPNFIPKSKKLVMRILEEEFLDYPLDDNMEENPFSMIADMTDDDFAYYETELA